MSAILNAASITGRIGAGSILLADYQLEIQPIENGYRLRVTRGSEVQTMDVPDAVGIAKIERVGESDGANDYRITFTDGSTFDYRIEPGEEAREAAEAERRRAEAERTEAFAGYEARIAAVEARLGGLSFAVNAEDGGLDIIYNN